MSVVLRSCVTGTCRSTSRRRFICVQTPSLWCRAAAPSAAGRRSVGRTWIKAVVLSRLRGAVVAAGSAIVGRRWLAQRSATASVGALICRRTVARPSSPPFNWCFTSVSESAHRDTQPDGDWLAGPLKQRLEAGAGGARRGPDDIVSAARVNHCRRRSRVLSRRSN